MHIATFFFVTLLSLISSGESIRRIVNGEEATPGQFPYQALVQSDFPSMGTFECGGSILSANYVLTGASCVLPATAGAVLVGVHNRFQVEPSQQEFAFSADNIRIHPGFTWANMRNNIATIQMVGGIHFTDRVQPVRLPTRSDGRSFAGMMGTVSGFGGTSDENNDVSPVLRYAQNPIMTNADCLAAFGQNENLIQEQNICQYGVGGRGACNNDMGGPLTVMEEDEGSLQVGIVSIVAVMCKFGEPVGFTRVSYFLDWIEENSDVVVGE